MTTFKAAEIEANDISEIEDSVRICLQSSRKGKRFSLDTVASVQIFYKRDYISRWMSGEKDGIALNQPNGKRNNDQKIQLGNIIELYTESKRDHQNSNISFTMFGK